MKLPRGVRPENIEKLLPDAVPPSKDALIAYWTKIHKVALPYLARRPLRLVRHVPPITFYHKDRLPPVPPAVHQLRMRRRSSGMTTRVWVDDLDGLLGLVAMDAVEVHPWHATVDDIEHPDQLAFNLKPGKGTSWGFVCETALRLNELLKQAGCRGWPKTTGGPELHVLASITTSLTHDQVRDAADTIAALLVARESRYTVNSQDKRPGSLLIDCQRNGFNASSIGVYSPRAKRDFPIAMKVTWKQIEAGISPDRYTLADPRGRCPS
jgi:bifunctional non-homologous end joining protein LigD